MQLFARHNITMKLTKAMAVNIFRDVGDFSSWTVDGFEASILWTLLFSLTVALDLHGLPVLLRGHAGPSRHLPAY